MTNDGVNQYLYDAEGRICAVENAATSAYGYLYDAEGHRVARGSLSSFSCDLTANGFTLVNQYMVGPNGEEVAEMDANGNWMHSNVYLGSELLATYTPTDLVFNLHDWLGTKRVEVGTSGCSTAFVQFP